ncbi:MAG TPA: hypothetical protein VF599_08370 [Pyrinomonadaceae bacterium]|jgi:hypothetical protein
MAAIEIFRGVGPVPISFEFNSPVEGPATFVLSATAYAQSVGEIAITLVLDGGTPLGTARCWANQTGSHMSLITTFMPVELLKYKSHSMMLVSGATPTLTDSNDYFQVTLLY